MEIQTVDAFLDYYEKIRLRTVRVVECIPPERIEWAPKAGKFSFGDLIRPLAALERFMFAENVAGRPSRYPGHGRALADGYEVALQYFHDCHAGSIDIFTRLTDANLQQKCTTPACIDITIWKWLRAMIEHEVHHRGQFYLMLGLLDVPTPPLYGLTSEEVLAQSVA